MLSSEIIKKLTNFIEEYGDKEVYFVWDMLCATKVKNIRYKPHTENTSMICGCNEIRNDDGFLIFGED